MARRDDKPGIWKLTVRLQMRFSPVSIKHGLRTTDYGLRTTDYGLGIKHGLRYKTRTKHYGLGMKYGLGIKRGLSITDSV